MNRRPQRGTRRPRRRVTRSSWRPATWSPWRGRREARQAGEREKRAVMASSDGVARRAAMVSRASSADDRVLKNQRDTKESLADWAKRTLANGREQSRGGRIYSRGVIMKAQRDLRRGKNVPNNAHAATTTSFVLVVCSRRTTSIPVTEGVCILIWRMKHMVAFLHKIECT